MSADFNKPLPTQSSDDILQQLKDNIDSLAKMNLGDVATAPTGSIAYVTDRFKRKKSDGTWEELPLTLNLNAISSTSIEAESIIVQDTLAGVSGGAATGNTVEISGGDITASGNVSADNITTLQNDVTTLKQNSASNLVLGTAAGASNDLNIVKSGGNVSINVPDASDTVRGVITAGTQTLGGNKTFSSTKIQLGSSATASSNWHLIGSGSFKILSGNIDSGTERLLIDNLGNVGIGTTPSEKLHIQGNIKSTNGHLYLTTGYSVQHSSNSHQWRIGPFYAEDSYSIVYSQSNFATSYTPAITINSSMNVGIGTILPSSLLHVNNGDIRLSNSNGTSAVVSKSTDRTTISSNSTSNNLVIMDSGSVGLGTSYDPTPYGKLTLNTTGVANSTTRVLGIVNSANVDNATLRIGGFSSSGVLQTAIDFIQSSSNASNLDSKIAFSTTDSVSTTEKVRISSSGNVGIGTQSPSSKLDVIGLISATCPSYTYNSTLGSSSGAGLYVRSTNNSFGILFGVAANGDGWIQTQRSDGGTIAGTNPPAHPVYNLNLQASGGKVGIGTTSPDDVLHVRNDTATTTSIRIQTNDQRLNLSAYWESGKGQYSTISSTNSSGGGGNLRIESDNLSILTTATNTVNKAVMTCSAGNSSFSFLPNLDQGGYNPLSKAGDLGIIFSTGTQNSGNLVIGPWASYALGMRITNSGKVGIGTADPSCELDVTGQIRTTSHLTSNANLRVDGNVHIGIASAQTEKLYVNGDIKTPVSVKCQDVICNGNVNSWRGYIGGEGISYSGAAARWGHSGNLVALTWGSPHIYGSVDHNVEAILGTVSDYRLKENFTPIESTLDLVLQLTPGTYNPKDFDGTVNLEKQYCGLIAHEAQAIIPSVVLGQKDRVNDDGQPMYQSVDYAGIVPYLIVAIKELKQHNDELNSKLQQLENQLKTITNA